MILIIILQGNQYRKPNLKDYQETEENCSDFKPGTYLAVSSLTPPSEDLKKVALIVFLVKFSIIKKGPNRNGST